MIFDVCLNSTLIGGLEDDVYDFPFSWECHHPDEFIFFRGVETTNQYILRLLKNKSQNLMM